MMAVIANAKNLEGKWFTLVCFLRPHTVNAPTRYPTHFLLHSRL